MARLQFGHRSHHPTKNSTAHWTQLPSGEIIGVRRTYQPLAPCHSKGPMLIILRHGTRQINTLYRWPRSPRRSHAANSSNMKRSKNEGQESGPATASKRRGLGHCGIVEHLSGKQSVLLAQQCTAMHFDTQKKLLMSNTSTTCFLVSHSLLAMGSSHKQRSVSNLSIPAAAGPHCDHSRADQFMSRAFSATWVKYTPPTREATFDGTLH